MINKITLVINYRVNYKKEPFVFLTHFSNIITFLIATCKHRPLAFKKADFKIATFRLLIKHPENPANTILPDLQISPQTCGFWKFSAQVCGFCIFGNFLRIINNFEWIFLYIFVKLSPHARVAKRQMNLVTSWKEPKISVNIYILTNLRGNDIPKNTPF